MSSISVPEIFVTALKDVAFFPVWWYTTGLFRTINLCHNALAGYSRSLGVKIWLQNLFVPMFGQNDWQSRIISFFMRLIQIIGRIFLVIVWGLFLGLLFLAYFVGPVVLGVALLYYLFGGLIIYGR